MDSGSTNLDVNYDEAPNLSPLERELLKEYQKLAKSLASVSDENKLNFILITQMNQFLRKGSKTNTAALI